MRPVVVVVDVFMAAHLDLLWLRPMDNYLHQLYTLCPDPLNCIGGPSLGLGCTGGHFGHFDHFQAWSPMVAKGLQGSRGTPGLVEMS